MFDLLAKGALRAPQHRPDVIHLHTHGLRDLEVGETAVAKDEHRCGVAREPPERRSNSFSVLVRDDDGLWLLRATRADAVVRPTLVAPPSAQLVQREVGGCCVKPSCGVFHPFQIGEAPSGRDECLLGDILGEVRVANHRVGNPDRCGEVLAEERFETIRRSLILRSEYSPDFAPHHLFSTARGNFVTLAEGFPLSPTQGRLAETHAHHHKDATSENL
jgi:hypothetical protein